MGPASGRGKRRTPRHRGSRRGRGAEIDRSFNKWEPGNGRAASQWVGSGGGARAGAGRDGGAGRGWQKGAERVLLNGGKAAGALTAASPPGSCGGVSCRRGWSLCLLGVRWPEDAPERRGCGGGGGGGRVGSGTRVERRRQRRRRRRAGPGGVNGGGGGGRAHEGEAAAGVDAETSSGSWASD